jgi:GxxExxY protein
MSSTTEDTKNTEARGGDLDRLNAIGAAIVDSAMKVHTVLGPGLLEGVYELCLVQELAKRGYTAERQIPINVSYDGIDLGTGFRADVVVDRSVLIEIKAVEALLPVHTAQLLTYLKLGAFPLGYLLNFNSARLRDGIKRLISKDPPRASVSSASSVVESRK